MDTYIPPYLSASCINASGSRIKGQGSKIKIIDICIINTCIRIKDQSYVHHRYMHHAQMHVAYMQHVYTHHRFIHHGYIHHGFTHHGYIHWDKSTMGTCIMLRGPPRLLRVSIFYFPYTGHTISTFTRAGSEKNQTHLQIFSRER